VFAVMIGTVFLEAVLRRLPELQPGHVWLAGAGPGDPGLLTLHALAALAQADVVVHDALVDARVLDLAHPDATRVFAGKRGGKPSTDQADITARLVTLAREGRRVLRLKGGDPFVFGRGGEEVLTLAAHGIPFRVIPGITSGLAALTAALIPATLRGANQAILLATGHGAADLAELPGGDGGLDWPAFARLGQPIVLYMAIPRWRPSLAP
jgi:uroporphyrin-III C-methyltransferase